MATIVQAVRMALHMGEEKLGVTDIFGEDVGPPLGGVFTATQGLKTAWNTPLDERGIVGMAMGLALAGQKPVAEIQFCDYAFNTIDLLKLAGSTYWSCAGDWNVPMTLMTPVGAGIHGSIYHSHSFESQATRLPGWKIVMPSNPRDAYSALLAAIDDPNPAMVLLPKALMRARAEGPDELIPGEPDAKQLRAQIDAPIGDRSSWVPEWPDLPLEKMVIGSSARLREGSDLSVVTYGRLARVAMKAADRLREQEGLSVEVIDLRWLHPYDWDAIEASARKTTRLLFLNEDTEVTNFGEHLVRRACETLFGELRIAPRLHAGAHLPGVGLAATLEDASVPTLESTIDAIREAVNAPEIGRSRRDVPRVTRRAPEIDFTLDADALQDHVVTREVFGRSLRYR